MKNWTTLGLFLLMCGSLALAACGGGGKTNEGGGGNKAGGSSTASHKRLPVPDEYKSKKPPKDLSDPDLIAAGKKLYHDGNTANCVSCHGEGGKGDGQLAPNYKDPAVVDLTAASFQDEVTDQYIFWRITKPAESNAYPAMSMLGYPAGSEEDNWALTAYVRSLKGS